MTSSASADLIISEYVEGSSFNKAIELFNTGTDDIDMSQVEIRFYFNGSTSASNTINAADGMSGTLSAGQVYVIADEDWALGSDSEIDLKPDGNFFNGDDAIEVRLNGTVVDVLGQIGNDPGSEWGTGTQSTQNNTLTRNIDILTGDADGSDAFDPSVQWRGGAQNSHSLGSHDGNFNTAAVPEPASAAVLGLVAACGLFVRRRK